MKRFILVIAAVVAGILFAHFYDVGVRAEKERQIDAMVVAEPQPQSDPATDEVVTEPEIESASVNEPPPFSGDEPVESVFPEDADLAPGDPLPPPLDEATGLDSEAADAGARELVSVLTVRAQPLTRDERRILLDRRMDILSRLDE